MTTEVASAPGRARQVVLVAMILANSIILVDQTAVPLALPSILSQFGVAAQAVEWVLNASLLALSGFLILGGRLGDQFGRRRVFLIGAIAFAAGSTLGGVAPAFPVLLGARVVQGLGGALMLPGSVAIVSATFPAHERGKALGTMGGVSAIAGALGPTIGGALTSAVSWRLVLLCLAIVGLVFGLTESESASFASPVVLGPLAVAVVTAVAFLWWEHRAADPLMDLGLLRRTPNYLGATISQGLAGMVEMGLGLIFPLLLILNLGMSPVLAGIALIPTTVPMIFLSTVVGRWYDRSGGRPPLVAGFSILAVSGVALGLGVHLIGPTTHDYFFLLPGLLLFGTGLALVLTANDPVSLDSVDDRFACQVSGVSATAEQAGGAIGIAGLYAVFHAIYVHRLQHLTHAGSSTGLTPQQGKQLSQALQAAEQTGLQPHHFDPSLFRYLLPAFNASKLGYGVVFFAVSALSVVGALLAARSVRKPRDPAEEPRPEPVG